MMAPVTVSEVGEGALDGGLVATADGVAAGLEGLAPVSAALRRDRSVSALLRRDRSFGAGAVFYLRVGGKGEQW